MMTDTCARVAWGPNGWWGLIPGLGWRVLCDSVFDPRRIEAEKYVGEWPRTYAPIPAGYFTCLIDARKRRLAEMFCSNCGAEAAEISARSAVPLCETLRLRLQ